MNRLECEIHKFLIRKKHFDHPIFFSIFPLTCGLYRSMLANLFGFVVPYRYNFVQGIEKEEETVYFLNIF